MASMLTPNLRLPATGEERSIHYKQLLFRGQTSNIATSTMATRGTQIICTVDYGSESAKRERERESYAEKGGNPVLHMLRA